MSFGFSKFIREGQSEASELEDYHQIGLRKTLGDAVLQVDLHWLIYPRERAFCQLDTTALMSRATSVPFGPTHAFVLAPADMLIHCASQLVNDSLTASYQRIADIYAIAKGFPSWDASIETAKQAGAAGATHLALSYAAMLGANVPPWVFRELKHACPGCQVTSAYLAVPSRVFRGRLAPDAALPIFMTLLYGRFVDRIRYLALFVTDNWRASRRRRSALRSVLILAGHVIGLGHRSVAILASHALRHTARNAPTAPKTALK
jgi:hypothetical protein